MLSVNCNFVTTISLAMHIALWGPTSQYGGHRIIKTHWSFIDGKIWLADRGRVLVSTCVESAVCQRWICHQIRNSIADWCLWFCLISFKEFYWNGTADTNLFKYVKHIYYATSKLFRYFQPLSYQWNTFSLAEPHAFSLPYPSFYALFRPSFRLQVCLCK